MDISDYPPFVFWFLACAVLWLMWLQSKRIERRKLRGVSRTVSGLAAGMLSFIFSLFCLFQLGCDGPVRAPAAWSQDRAHVALLSWGQQGALGADFAGVNLRPARSLRAERVYSASGIHGEDPKVAWEGPSHLVIHYDPTYKEAGSGYEVHCSSGAFGVTVTCIADLKVWDRNTQ